MWFALLNKRYGIVRIASIVLMAAVAVILSRSFGWNYYAALGVGAAVLVAINLTWLPIERAILLRRIKIMETALEDLKDEPKA
jgi:hypothetical protein